jgi:hypothetical protein
LEVREEYEVLMVKEILEKWVFFVEWENAKVSV